MAQIVVNVNTKSSLRLMRQLETAVGDETNFRSSRGIIMRRTLLQLTDNIKKRISTGNGGRWKPLSPWTIARTGRTVPLQTLAGRVRSRTFPKRAEIYFKQSSPEWSLSTHHKGYAVSAVRNTFMRVPQLRGPAITFRNRRAFTVPARPVWPSERSVRIILNNNIRAFIITHVKRGSSAVFGPSR